MLNCIEKTIVLETYIKLVKKLIQKIYHKKHDISSNLQRIQQLYDVINYNKTFKLFFFLNKCNKTEQFNEKILFCNL